MSTEQRTVVQNASKQRPIRPGDSFRLTVDAIPGCWFTVTEVEGDLVRADSESGWQSMWSVKGLMSGYAGNLQVEWKR